ncbi:MAG TPA: hypothetical protein VHO25_21980 [Polyangiaceae bacterium]|nr:hypothetical protein [Polyangiaceae bacterium]
MGIHARIHGLTAALGLLAAVEVAHAEPLDPTLSRFVLDSNCNSFIDPASGLPVTGRYNPNYPAPGGNGECTPRQELFTRLINDWAFIVAPNAMHSARTTGYGGFHFSLQGAYTKIANEQQHWTLGAQGDRDPSTGQASTNARPPALVQHYSIVARKSFGFGFETALNLGFVPSSSIITGGADARIALLEGFRTGILGIFPDIAGGGSVRTITGTTEFQLTVAAMDFQISKPLTIASSSVLTPWLGYQYLWIFGNSGLVDLTPATDPLGLCGFTGPDVPGTPGADQFNGQPQCAGGTSNDFNNNVVFDEVRLRRHRLMFGANYRYEIVSVGAQFITDLLSPFDAQKSGSAEKAHLAGVPKQWTLVLELGAHF